MQKKSMTHRLLRPINPIGIIILGVYTIIWGLWLVNPFWDVFSVADLYSKMAAAAPEWVWGTTAVLSGICISYGAIKPSYTTLTFGSMVGAIHWCILAAMYFWGDWQNTGGITSLFISTYAAFVYINIKVNKVTLEETLTHQDEYDTIE